MRKRTLPLIAIAIVAAASQANAVDWTQWRGPQRSGVSAEKGLAQKWPAAGPKLVWQMKDVGDGYGSPSIVGNHVYLLGSEGLDNEFVESLDAKTGQRIWRERIGKVGDPDQDPNYPAARSTPTIDGDRLYAFGSDGDIACLETATGRIVWKKNVRQEFNGVTGGWAYAESPLVDGNVVVCTPGGWDASMVALNKTSGEVIWKCQIPEAGEAGYASAIVVNFGGRKQYVQFFAQGVVGIDAANGKFLWRAGDMESDNMATPIEQGGFIYAPAGGVGGGLAQLVTGDDGISAKQVYKKRGLPNKIGGAILIDGFLYGTTQDGLVCADFKTGENKWSSASIGIGAVCSADGLLFIHGENDEVALVEATPLEYREMGRFKLPDPPQRKDQMEKAWSHPVVANGRLYVRDKNILWCYDVSDAASSK